MRFAILPLAVILTMSLPASPLEPYEWENRLILYRASDPYLKELQKIIEKNEDEIADRDLLFLRLGQTPDLPFHKPLSETDLILIEKRFGIVTDKSTALFVLLGKDGGEKSRQSGKLDIEQWFDQIDSMPMRQREMRNND